MSQNWFKVSYLSFNYLNHERTRAWKQRVVQKAHDRERSELFGGSKAVCLIYKQESGDDFYAEYWAPKRMSDKLRTELSFLKQVELMSFDKVFFSHPAGVQQASLFVCFRNWQFNGNSNFFAPEACLPPDGKRSIEPSFDIYGLGLLTMELISGRRPNYNNDGAHKYLKNLVNLFLFTLLTRGRLAL